MFRVSNLLFFFFLFIFVKICLAQEINGGSQQPVSENQSKKSELIESEFFYKAVKENDKEYLLNIASRFAFGELDINITDSLEKADAISFLAEMQVKNNNHALSFLLYSHPIFSDPKLSNQYRWNVLAALHELTKVNQAPEYKIHLGRKILAEILRGEAIPNPAASVYLVNTVANSIGELNRELQFYLFELNFKKINEEIAAGHFDIKDMQAIVFVYVTDFYKLPDRIDRTQLSVDDIKYIPVGTLRHWYIRDLIKAIEVSSYSLDQKADLVGSLVWRTEARSTAQMFSEVLGWAEQLLFAPVDKYEANQSQISVLLPSLNNKDYWPFTRTREEVFKHIEYRADKYKDWYTRFALAMFRSREYLDLGEFDLANEEIQYMERNPVPSSFMGANFSRGMSLIALLFRHKHYELTGNYGRATNLIEKIDTEINWFGNQFLSEFPSMVSYVGSFGRYYEFKLLVTKPDDVIRDLDILIQKLGLPSKQNDNLDSSRAQLYEVMHKAYLKKGDLKLAYKYRSMAYEAELTGGHVSLGTALRRYYENVRYIVDNESLSFDAFGSARSNIELAAQINNRGKKSFQREEFELNKVVVDSANKLLVDLKDSKKNKRELLKQHCADVSTGNELNADQIIRFGNYESSSILLSTMYFYYSCAGDAVYSAYYAKRHINLLQDVRFSLSQKNTLLNQFTEGISDTLRKYAENFYDVGDYESAATTLKIIKENEFYDFVRRNAGSSFSYSVLSFSKSENEIQERINTLFDEIQIISKRINSLNNHKDAAEIQSLGQAISVKREDVKKLKNILRMSLYKTAAKTKDVYKKTIRPHSSDEAIVEYSISPDVITLYIYTASSIKKYEYKLSRVEFRNLVLQMQKTLIANKKVNEVDFSDLSNSLMVDKIADLKNSGIDRIKLMTSDYLGLIPFSILRSKNSLIGDLFSVRIVGLSAPVVERASPNSVSVFGATKGFKRFSPLPHVQDEVEFINKLNAQNRKISRNSVFLDRKFTKDALINSYNSGTSFIHVATHYDPTKTQNSSGQLLMGDGSFITLNELINALKKNENVRLVTLSACETGSFYPGAGLNALEGLSNIFVINGAENVLGTLWAVSDAATSDFMKVFYFLLDRNVSAGEALRITQLIFRTANLKHLDRYASPQELIIFEGLKGKLSSYLNPYYWAGFQLISQ